MSSLVSNTSLADIAALARAGRNFVVCSHVRPDGDAIGSSVALALSLARLGKSVRVLNEDGLPESLAFLPGARALIARPDGRATADAVFALDTATSDRLGAGVHAAVDGLGPLVNIDHHRSNPGYGDHYFIDADAPATGQIIYDLLAENDLPLDREIAENLFAAISTDTGSFQYDSTTSRTLRVAADLVDRGLHVGDLNRRLYQSYPLPRIRLLGELLSVLDISAGGRCAAWHLTRAMAERAGASPDDSENLIDHIRSIDGVLVAAFFEELPDGRIRLSLRSKDPRFDASAVCAAFGGGGHRMAAGARLAGPLESARQRVLSTIHDALASI